MVDGQFGHKQRSADVCKTLLVVTTIAVPDGLISPFRKICMSLPDVVEASTQGGIVFKVGRRTLANVIAVVGADEETVTVATVRAEPDEVLALTASGHPFFRLRSANTDGWVGAILDSETDWSEIREVVIESFVFVAPKRLLEQLEIPD